MIYRKLGGTGIDVGVIGLGAEYLEHSPRDVIESIVDAAIDSGVNYIDLFMASPQVRDNFGLVLEGRRQQVMVAGHLGAIMQDNQYTRSRDKALCQKFFDDLLTRLRTDYIDVLMLHFVDAADDYEGVFGSNGLLEQAIQLKKEGKARLIGMSSHYVPVALEAVKSGQIDVLMFPVNPAVDALPADTQMDAVWQASSYSEPATSAATGREELYHACATQGVGIIAMKTYAAGWLFKRGNPSSIVLTPVQCLSYALSQPGVCTTVPGCKTLGELKAALAYLEASEQDGDFSAIDASPAWKLRGSCMYCNHCLPCPVGIDIGVTTRLADTATYEKEAGIIAEYQALAARASFCTECGDCVERCPFGVDVIANMRRAAGIFEEQSPPPGEETPSVSDYRCP